MTCVGRRERAEVGTVLAARLCLPRLARGKVPGTKEFRPQLLSRGQKGPAASVCGRGLPRGPERNKSQTVSAVRLEAGARARLRSLRETGRAWRGPGPERSRHRCPHVPSLPWELGQLQEVCLGVATRADLAPCSPQALSLPQAGWTGLAAFCKPARTHPPLLPLVLAGMFLQGQYKTQHCQPRGQPSDRGCVRPDTGVCRERPAAAWPADRPGPVPWLSGTLDPRLLAPSKVAWACMSLLPRKPISQGRC